jgi:pyrophosphatase PpaX
MSVATFVDTDVVLFDWDGTLVDTGDLLLSCWHQMSEIVLGYTFPVTDEDRRYWLSMRAAESFPKLGDTPEKVEQLFVEFERAYFELAPGRVSQRLGARQLLESLRAQGRRTGLVTSKTRVRVGVDMHESGLVDLFDIVLASEDVQAGKPDPEGILIALQHMNAAKDRSVYIGDMSVDIEAGKAAGIRTIALANGIGGHEALVASQPDLIVHDLDEVARALGFATHS